MACLQWLRRRSARACGGGTRSHEVVLRNEMTGALDFRTIRGEERVGWRSVVPKLVHQIAPGSLAHAPGYIHQRAGHFFLKPQSIAPQLGRTGHQRMFVLQPAAELLLADRKRLGIAAGLDLITQRRAE